MGRDRARRARRDSFQAIQADTQNWKADFTVGTKTLS